MKAMCNSSQNYTIKLRISLVAGQARHDNATNVIKEVPAFAGSDCYRMTRQWEEQEIPGPESDSRAQPRSKHSLHFTPFQQPTIAALSYPSKPDRSGSFLPILVSISTTIVLAKT